MFKFIDNFFGALFEKSAKKKADSGRKMTFHHSLRMDRAQNEERVVRDRSGDSSRQQNRRASDRENDRDCSNDNLSTINLNLTAYSSESHHSHCDHGHASGSSDFSCGGDFG